MYSLFTQKNQPIGSITVPAQFEWLQSSYQAEISKIKQYYRTRVYTLPNQHILVRALTTALVPMEYDAGRYAEVASARSPYVSKYFKFTSTIEPGHVQQNSFYGGNIDEYILSIEDYVNPFDTPTSWFSEPCVKVIEHPVSDLSLTLPTGSDYSDASGTSVISIDLPRLLLQYRAFFLEQERRIQHGSEQRLGIPHFIHMYILPQLLDTHLDWVWLNRLMARFYGAPNSVAMKKLPFAVLDYHDKIDAMADQVIKRLKNSKMWYTHSLQNIPSFYKTNMLEALQMPDIALTSHVWWLLFMSRLTVMRFLIDIGGKEGLRSNRGYINQLQIHLKRLISSGIPNGVLSKDIQFDFDYEANRILKL